MVKKGDIAEISRRANAIYDLKILKQGSNEFNQLKKYLIHYIGHRGKQFGYIQNTIFDEMLTNRRAIKKNQAS